MGKNQDPDPGWKKIRIQDPEWKKLGPGINIPDPQHCHWKNKTQSKKRGLIRMDAGTVWVPTSQVE
jgi:hypothetical protein